MNGMGLFASTRRARGERSERGGVLRKVRRIAVVVAVAAVVLPVLPNTPKASGLVFLKSARWPVTPDSGRPGGGDYVDIPVCIIAGSNAEEGPPDVIPEIIPDDLLDFVGIPRSSAELPKEDNPPLREVIGAMRGALHDGWSKATNVRFTEWRDPCPAPTDADAGRYIGLSIRPDGGNNACLGPAGLGNVTDTNPTGDNCPNDRAAVHIQPWGPTFGGEGEINEPLCLRFEPSNPFDYSDWKSIATLRPDQTDFKWRYDLACARQYGLHEFGHVLGFSHESTHPATPDYCLSRNSENVVDEPAATDYDADPSTGTNTFVPYSELDPYSIMLYSSNDCVDPNTLGVRFGGNKLSAADFEGSRLVYPPIVDVGVLNAGTCGTAEQITVTLPLEKNAPTAGWIGVSSGGGNNVAFQFCRADGRTFKPLTETSASSTYAVLNLSGVCPPGSIRAWQTISTRTGDDPVITSNVPDLNLEIPHRFGAADLPLCVFPAGGEGAVDSMPDLGHSYGVFATSSFGPGKQFGAISVEGGLLSCNTCPAVTYDALTKIFDNALSGLPDMSVRFARVGRNTPVITPTVTGTLGNGDWYTSDVTVSFDVQYANFTDDCGEVTVSEDTAGREITCYANNEDADESSTVTVKRDTTAPTIAQLANVPERNDLRWNNTPVTVTFDCDDETSGLVPDPASSQVSFLLSEERSGQEVTGRCKDVAGNEAMLLSGPVHIDRTPPDDQLRRGAPRTERERLEHGQRHGALLMQRLAVRRARRVAVAGPDRRGQGSDHEGGVQGQGEQRELARQPADRHRPHAAGRHIPRSHPRSEPTPDHNQAVLVRWTCTDALSGPQSDTVGAGCPVRAPIRSRRPSATTRPGTGGTSGSRTSMST